MEYEGYPNVYIHTHSHTHTRKYTVCTVQTTHTANVNIFTFKDSKHTDIRKIHYFFLHLAPPPLPPPHTSPPHTSPLPHLSNPYRCFYTIYFWIKMTKCHNSQSWNITVWKHVIYEVLTLLITVNANRSH